MQSVWSPVALAVDIPPGLVIPAVLPERELAIWRGASGQLAAWLDRCPHRGMRLSHGFVRGDMLSCLYHGWRYDVEGQCRKIPAHPDLVPPEAICTSAYRCVEQSGVVWVALQDTSSPPPVLPEAQPLCSLPIDAPVEAVASAVGLDATSGRVTLGDLCRPLVLALQPRPRGSTLHALLGDDDDQPALHRGAPLSVQLKTAALAALEDLRRTLEADSVAPAPIGAVS